MRPSDVAVRFNAYEIRKHHARESVLWAPAPPEAIGRIVTRVHITRVKVPRGVRDQSGQESQIATSEGRGR